MKGCFIRTAVPPARMGLDGFSGVGAGSREKRVARRCGVD